MLLLVLGLAPLISLDCAQAQEKYPNRPIELVVPFSMGGGSDTGARIFNDKLARVLQVPVNVVNRAGGSGIEGTNYVAKAKKDGYTLLWGTIISMTLLPIMSKEVPYDAAKDFKPLAHFLTVPSVFAVKSDSEFKTMGELIEYARQNPGKLKAAASGSMTVSAFNLALLCSKNNVNIVTIPFEGGGEIISSILGGHVAIAASTLAGLGPQIRAGKLRGLAITSPTRHPDFPNMPTTVELGLPYMNINMWQGIFAPAGTPDSALNVLAPALESVSKNQEFIQLAVKAGLTVDYKGPKQFQELIASETPVIRQIAKEAKLSRQ
jgi:tripartite-type tricarboxylate transporter receptor subunit TctC